MEWVEWLHWEWKKPILLLASSASCCSVYDGSTKRWFFFFTGMDVYVCVHVGLLCDWPFFYVDGENMEFGQWFRLIFMADIRHCRGWCANLYKKMQSLSNGFIGCIDKTPKRREYFSPLSSGLVCVFLPLGHVTSMTASLKELHFDKSAVAILLFPVEHRLEQKCHVSNIQKTSHSANHVERITQYFRGLREKLPIYQGRKWACRLLFFKALSFHFIECHRQKLRVKSWGLLEKHFLLSVLC